MTGRGAVGAHDEGAGAVLVLALVAVLAVAAGVLATAVRQLGAQQDARTAADLAALAAAQSFALPAGLTLARGAVPPDQACERAGLVAERNGAALRSCDVVAGVVSVRVGSAGPLGAAEARARAGPRSARDG